MDQCMGRLCACSCGFICLFCIQLTFITVAFALGLALALKPRKVIDLQIAIYRPFNWEIKPISMEKEIRNMRITGAVCIIASATALVYLLAVKGSL